MYRCPPCINLAIPGEYRKTAESLFPLGGFAPGQGPDLKAAADFAKALGISADYQRLLALNKTDREMTAFLRHFQNNLDLLIQKTWVEKVDEARKEQLQDEIPGFMADIEQGNFRQALEEFGAILGELAYLLFGAQSAKDDFTEYTFRIDTQMGLFWWYGGRLNSLKDLSHTGPRDAESLWAVLLIGICYLTNF
ncbi:MAG: hypothetical protein LBD47_11470 [Treponema sp.]|jgi:hypothetical protein|nr:hypothetical protein [Treponema sp.]